MVYAETAEEAVGKILDNTVEEEQKYIWDRYYKADSSRSYHKKGTGLGLYIVKSIINQHNQEIEIKSDDNSVEFSFTLNLTNC